MIRVRVTAGQAIALETTNIILLRNYGPKLCEHDHDLLLFGCPTVHGPYSSSQSGRLSSSMQGTNMRTRTHCVSSSSTSWGNWLPRNASLIVLQNLSYKEASPFQPGTRRRLDVTTATLVSEAMQSSSPASALAHLPRCHTSKLMRWPQGSRMLRVCTRPAVHQLRAKRALDMQLSGWTLGEFQLHCQKASCTSNWSNV